MKIDLAYIFKNQLWKCKLNTYNLNRGIRKLNLFGFIKKVAVK